MKKVKPNLKKMLEEIEWVKIDSGRASNILPNDAITVAFVPSKKNNPDLINRVNIRFGKDVIQQLKWSEGDKIVVMHDKNNLMNFLLVKTESGTGFKLSKAIPGVGFKISFIWKHVSSLKKRPADRVEYYIKNNQLIIFTVKPE